MRLRFTSSSNLPSWSIGCASGRSGGTASSPVAAARLGKGNSVGARGRSRQRLRGALGLLDGELEAVQAQRRAVPLILGLRSDVDLEERGEQLELGVAD